MERQGTCLGNVLREKNMGGGEAHISKVQKRNVEAEMKAEVVE
jgi:hypothetical protein